MSDTSYPLNIAGPKVAISDAEPAFYVVSKRKFTILFLATLGLYYLYWFYKNWSRYQDQAPYASEAKNTIWPFPRAMFAVFFVHSLFRKIREYGIDKPQVDAWANGTHAGLVVLLLLVSNALDRLASKGIGSPWTDLLSLLILAPMLFAFLNAQEIINVACDDPAGAGNATLSVANYVWIVIGVIFWLLIFVGLVLPDPGS